MDGACGVGGVSFLQQTLFCVGIWVDFKDVLIPSWIETHFVCNGLGLFWSRVYIITTHVVMFKLQILLIYQGYLAEHTTFHTFSSRLCLLFSTSRKDARSYLVARCIWAWEYHSNNRVIFKRLERWWITLKKCWVSYKIWSFIWVSMHYRPCILSGNMFPHIFGVLIVSVIHHMTSRTTYGPVVQQLLGKEQDMWTIWIFSKQCVACVRMWAVNLGFCNPS